MKLITQEGKVYGNFTSIEKKETYYDCDGVHYSFKIFGSDCTISNDNSPIIVEEKVEVPQIITKLQAMKYLKQIGKWEEVKTILASDEDINDEWLLSNELNRSYPLVVQMGTALNLNDEQLDNLFIEASKLN